MRDEYADIMARARSALRLHDLTGTLGPGEKLLWADREADANAALDRALMLAQTWGALEQHKADCSPCVRYRIWEGWPRCGHEQRLDAAYQSAVKAIQQEHPNG